MQNREQATVRTITTLTLYDFSQTKNELVLLLYWGFRFEISCYSYSIDSSLVEGSLKRHVFFAFVW